MDKKKENVNSLVNEINKTFSTFYTEAKSSTKAGQRRARKFSMILRKQLKQFRADSATAY